MLSACQREESSPTYDYLFLGHPYDWQRPQRVDPRLERIDYKQFAGVWLGGDVCAHEALRTSTLTYLDTLFDLDAPTTHWTLGNHDVEGGSLDSLSAFTKRPDFYVTNLRDLVIVNLNTNLFWPYTWAPPREDCERKDQQLAMLRKVCDTIQAASQLLILHHHALLSELQRGPNGDTLQAFNINPIPLRTDCAGEQSFTEQFYRPLTEVQQRGVQVVLIGGDLGMRAKRFHYRTPEGIWLLGSGINNTVDRAYAPAYVTNFEPDSVLIVTHRPRQREISWRFVRLNDLLKQQLGDAGWEALPDSIKNLR